MPHLFIKITNWKLIIFSMIHQYYFQIFNVMLSISSESACINLAKRRFQSLQNSFKLF